MRRSGIKSNSDPSAVDKRLVHRQILRNLAQPSNALRYLDALVPGLPPVVPVQADGHGPDVPDLLFGEGDDERGGIRLDDVLVGRPTPMLFGEDVSWIELLVVRFNLEVLHHVPFVFG